MKILVLVKQVPDTSEVKFNENGVMIREGLQSILNAFDQYAVEEALRIREKYGGEVSVMTLAPEQAKSALQKCLALGADKAYHISDRAFGGSDTLATSYALSLAIKKVGDFDLIMAGNQATDGDTGHIGPQVAQFLGLPHVSYVERVESIEGERALVKSLMEDGYRMVEVKLPALLACIPPTTFEYSNPSMMGIVKAKNKPYIWFKADDIDGDKSRFGLNGSPTRVLKMYPPPKRSRGEVFTGDYHEAVKKIIDVLKEKKVIS